MSVCLNGILELVESSIFPATEQNIDTSHASPLDDGWIPIFAGGQWKEPKSNSGWLILMSHTFNIVFSIGVKSYRDTSFLSKKNWK